MDLAAFFTETAADIAPRARSPVPAFPVSRNGCGNGQTTDIYSISRVSRISREPKDGNAGSGKFSPQAGARAGGGAGAREGAIELREKREQREMPAELGPYRSRSLSQKREKERKTGNSGHLPVAPSLSVAFDERAAFLEFECGLPRVVAERQALADLEPKCPAPAGLSAVEGLALWRARLAALDTESPPCPGYRGVEWSTTLARALVFLEAFGEQAIALGWTAPRLFGVHPAAGIVRVDACGALVLPIGGAVRALTATEVAFGHLTHRTKIGQSEGVPIWDFAAGAERDRLRLSSIARQCLSTGTEEARAMLGLSKAAQHQTDGGARA